ncbi:hypothetical protein HZH68_002436 [Vespula germanica]|uniref:Uncharacterized protein n=1 Tax=Vespula germanica TaxID=30212 RepID=A0A834NMA4_VESGE|nr:hypothetical protein HZH68_002436 [Vespula germanica]
MGTSVVLAKNGGAIRRSPCFRSDSTVLVGGCFHERLGIRRGSRRKAIQAIRIVDSRGDAGPGVATPTTTDDNNEEQEEKGERRGVARKKIWASRRSRVGAAAREKSIPEYRGGGVRADVDVDDVEGAATRSVLQTAIRAQAVCGADVLRVPVRVHLHAREPGPVKPVFRSVPGSWFPVPVPPHAKLSRQSSSERHTLLRRLDTILSDDTIQRLRFDDFD